MTIKEMCHVTRICKILLSRDKSQLVNSLVTMYPKFDPAELEQIVEGYLSVVQEDTSATLVKASRHGLELSIKVNSVSLTCYRCNNTHVISEDSLCATCSQCDLTPFHRNIIAVELDEKGLYIKRIIHDPAHEWDNKKILDTLNSAAHRLRHIDGTTEVMFVQLFIPTQEEISAIKSK